MDVFWDLILPMWLTLGLCEAWRLAWHWRSTLGVPFLGVGLAALVCYAVLIFAVIQPDCP
jgi:hypothetical protein